MKLIFLMLFIFLCSDQIAYSNSDRHAGFYYPVPSNIEEYNARSRRMQGTTRRTRIGFVVSIVDQMAKRPYPPTVSVFVKGDKAQKLIIVANEDSRLNTIFRVRAYLATLTSIARTLPVFTELKVEDMFTFLDLLKMLGFTQVTLSDGDIFSHQILIK